MRKGAGKRLGGHLRSGGWRRGRSACAGLRVILMLPPLLLLLLLPPPPPPHLRVFEGWRSSSTPCLHTRRHCRLHHCWFWQGQHVCSPHKPSLAAACGINERKEWGGEVRGGGGGGGWERWGGLSKEQRENSNVAIALLQRRVSHATCRARRTRRRRRRRGEARQGLRGDGERGTRIRLWGVRCGVLCEDCNAVTCCN